MFKINKYFFSTLIPILSLNIISPLVVNAEENEEKIQITEIDRTETETILQIYNPNQYTVRLPNGNWVSERTIKYKVNRNGTYDFVIQDKARTMVTQSFAVSGLRKTLLVTSKPEVLLKLQSEDTLSGMGQMKFKNESTGTWTSYEAYKTTKDWVLDSKEGLKSVYVMYKDVAGNETTQIYDQIYLDKSGPTISNFLINNGAKYTKVKNVTLTLTAVDNYSDVDYFLISNDGVTWTKTSNDTSIPWTLSDSVGTKTVYLKGVDTLGNVGSVYTQTIYYDNVLPTGSIKINNGESLTNSRNVKLQINFADIHSGVKRVSILEKDKVYTFPTVPTSPTEIDWTLSYGATGQVTLEVEDNAGNIYRTNSNIITIATLEITQFRLLDVVNPSQFNSSNPFKALTWDFPPQKMMAGGNIKFDLNYKLDLDNSTTAVIVGEYVVEIVGDNGYHKIITSKYDKSITNGFESVVKIPEDAPKDAKVYLYSTVEATLTNKTETFKNNARFPGATEKALIGTIDGNIKEGIIFNEIR